MAQSPQDELHFRALSEDGVVCVHQKVILQLSHPEQKSFAELRSIWSKAYSKAYKNVILQSERKTAV